MATASDRLPRKRKRAPTVRPAPGPVVQRCPFCHDDLRVDTHRWTACRDCLTRAHPSCWREAGACSVCGGTSSLVPPRSREAPLAGGRLVRHEAHVRALAILFLVGGLLVLGLSVFLWREAASLWRVPPLLRALMVGLPLLGLSQVGVSFGLWTYRPWARPHALVLLAVGLLLDVAQAISLQPGAVAKVVLSCGWSVAVAWALLSTNADRIFDPRYAAVMAREPGTAAWWRSPFFTIPAAVLVAVVAALLAVGTDWLR